VLGQPRLEAIQVLSMRGRFLFHVAPLQPHQELERVTPLFGPAQLMGEEQLIAPRKDPQPA